MKIASSLFFAMVANAGATPGFILVKVMIQGALYFIGLQGLFGVSMR